MFYDRKIGGEEIVGGTLWHTLWSLQRMHYFYHIKSCQSLGQVVWECHCCLKILTLHKTQLSPFWIEIWPNYSALNCWAVFRLPWMLLNNIIFQQTSRIPYTVQHISPYTLWSCYTDESLHQHVRASSQEGHCQRACRRTWRSWEKAKMQTENVTKCK